MSDIGPGMHVQPPPPPKQPDQPPPNLPPPGHTDGTLGGLIPRRNPNALLAYYLGVASLIPLLGIATGVAAVVLGIKGVKYARENPVAKGGAHAWTGIILGGLFGLFYLWLFGGLFIGMMSS